MDLKKFRKSVTALTLGMFLVANLGMSVFVKASDDGQKLPETTEKVEKIRKPVKALTLGTTIITCIGLAKLFLDKVVNVKENVENPKVTVSEENNNNSSEITEITKIEEKKDSITAENTNKSEIIEIDEIIEDDGNSEEENSTKRSKLGEYHQGVVASYLDAETLTKMKQVNKKTADGTKCFGFITQYIENFYEKFTQRIGKLDDYSNNIGNYLCVDDLFNLDGFLCEDLSSAGKLLHLLEQQVKVVFVKKDFTNDPEIIKGLNLNFNTIVHKYYYHGSNNGNGENTYAICAFFPRSYQVQYVEDKPIAKDLKLLYLRLKKHGYLYDEVCPHYPLDLGKFVFYLERNENTQAWNLCRATQRRIFYSRLSELGTKVDKEYYMQNSEFYDEQMRKNADELLLKDLGTTIRPEYVKDSKFIEMNYKNYQYAKEPVFRLFADVGKYGWATMYNQEEETEEDPLQDEYEVMKGLEAPELLYAMSRIEHNQFVSILHHCFDNTSPGWSWKNTSMRSRFNSLLDPTYVTVYSLLCVPSYIMAPAVPDLHKREGKNLNRDFVLNLITVLTFFRLPQEYNDVFLLTCFARVYDYLYGHDITIDEIDWLITEFDRAGLVTQDLVIRLKSLLPLLFLDDSGSKSFKEYSENEYAKFSIIFQENFRMYFPLLFRFYGRVIYPTTLPKLLERAASLESNEHN